MLIVLLLLFLPAPLLLQCSFCPLAMSDWQRGNKVMAGLFCTMTAPSQHFNGPSNAALLLVIFFLRHDKCDTVISLPIQICSVMASFRNDRQLHCSSCLPCHGFTIFLPTYTLARFEVALPRLCFHKEVRSKELKCHYTRFDIFARDEPCWASRNHLHICELNSYFGCHHCSVLNYGNYG